MSTKAVAVFCLPVCFFYTTLHGGSSSAHADSHVYHSNCSSASSSSSYSRQTTHKSLLISQLSLSLLATSRLIYNRRRNEGDAKIGSGGQAGSLMTSLHLTLQRTNTSHLQHTLSKSEANTRNKSYFNFYSIYFYSILFFLYFTILHKHRHKHTHEVVIHAATHSGLSFSLTSFVLYFLFTPTEQSRWPPSRVEVC